MEMQQNLKAVWKNLENIMTIDEEMIYLPKLLKQVAKKKIVKIIHSFQLFFAIKPCRDGGSKSEKRYQDAFNNAYERAEHAIFRVQVGVCLSLELCLLPRRGANFQKNEGLNLD